MNFIVLTSYFVLLQDQIALLGTLRKHILPSKRPSSPTLFLLRQFFFTLFSFKVIFLGLLICPERVGRLCKYVRPLYAKHKSVSLNEALWEKSSYLQQEPLIWWTPETQQPLKQLQDFCESKTIRVQNEQTWSKMTTLNNLSMQNSSENGQLFSWEMYAFNISLTWKVNSAKTNTACIL